MFGGASFSVVRCVLAVRVLVLESLLSSSSFVLCDVSEGPTTGLKHPKRGRNKNECIVRERKD